MQQRAKRNRPAMLKARAKIPPIFGTTTYVLATIAANGGVLRQTDISVSLGETAARAADVDDHYAGMLRTFHLKTKQGRGPRGLAIAFDETFPLAKEVFALARKIGQCHPIRVENKMPKEAPPRPSSRKHRIDLIAGSEVNTLVLATARALRGKVGRVELEASVPHHSAAAVERSVRRLRDCGILDAGKGRVYFADAPWRPQIEKLFDAYLRLRPEIRDQIRERAKTKRQRRGDRYEAGLFGYAATERILTTLAVRGPMRRTELQAVTMFMHRNLALRPLEKAGIIAAQSQPGPRSSAIVSLNAAFPAYREMRATLIALAGERTTRVRDLPHPRSSADDFDVRYLFDTAPLFEALLMMNAVRDGEIDVASLNRLRSRHAQFTLHERMHWLLDQGIAKVRRQGLILYYSLDQSHRAYRSLKRLLDRIGQVWPEMVEAAATNDTIKTERRRTIDRNAKTRSAVRGARS